MPFEVEKRAHLKNNEEYNQCKAYLDSRAAPLEKVEMETYLFLQPHYLRVRFEKESEIVTITHKSGTYGDPARKEIDVKLARSELFHFFELIEALGYKECSHLKSISYSYNLEGFRVDLTTHEHLGDIVEVEAVTEKESEIPELEERISKTIKSMDLEELDSDTYQKMMDEMYKKSLSHLAYNE